MPFTGTAYGLIPGTDYGRDICRLILSGLDDEPARRLLEEMDETNRGQP